MLSLLGRLVRWLPHNGTANRNAAKRPRPFHPRCESLEHRRLLAAIMVKDIAPLANSSAPYDLTNFNGTLFFTADDGVHGDELWKSDGTPDGTVLVKDIRPGSDNYGYPYSSSPSYLTNAGGTLYFFADDGAYGTALWKSDGTEAGTVRVKAFGPNFYYNGYEMATVGGTLFFAADDTTHGEELWKSDGTPAGTQLVKDIVPGDYDGYGYSSYPTQLTNVGGILYFVAADEEANFGLWKSDGTPEGTVSVKSFGSDYPIAYPDYLTDVDGTLFFTVNDGVHGSELWKSNGTPDGTVLVMDIAPGENEYGYPNGSYPYHLTNVGGVLYFTADDGVTGEELWKSDGTAAGTVLVKDIVPGPEGVYLSYDDFVDVGGTLYFFNEGGRGGLDELWKSDGTETGTVFVADIQPRGSGRYGSDPDRQPTNVGGVLYFVASIGPQPPPPCPRCGRPPGNIELWISDGTEEGTVPLPEIYPGSEGSFPYGLINVDGRLFFSADDGVHGAELWVVTPDLTDTPGDTDGDGDVDLTDLNNVRNHFGDVGPDILGDVNGDGEVDLDDLTEVRSHFGSSVGGTTATRSRLRELESLNIENVQPDTDRRVLDAIFASWTSRETDRQPESVGGTWGMRLRPKRLSFRQV